jgi:DnaK suppressor protein
MERQEALAELLCGLTKRRESLKKVSAGEPSLVFESRPDAPGHFVSTEIETESGSQLAEDAAAALKKIEAGQYGVCEVCETTIPISRMTAVPHATKCLRCQRQAEREGKD